MFFCSAVPPRSGLRECLSKTDRMRKSGIGQCIDSQCERRGDSSEGHSLKSLWTDSIRISCQRLIEPGGSKQAERTAHRRIVMKTIGVIGGMSWNPRRNTMRIRISK